MGEDSERVGAEMSARKGNGHLDRELPDVESPPLSPVGDSPEARADAAPVREPTDIILWQDCWQASPRAHLA